MNINQHLLPSKQFEKKFKDFLNPLFSQTKLNYFGYNRYYSSCKWSGLYSDCSIVETALQVGNTPLIPGQDGFVLKDGLYFFVDMNDLLHPYVSEELLEKYLKQAPSETHKKLNTNAFCFLRSTPYYQESFYFSTNLKIEHLKSYYTKIAPDLKNFISSFLYEMRNAIQKMDLTKTTYPPLTHIKTKNNRKKNFPKKICIAREWGDVFLSKREAECLSWLSQGMRYQDISTELNLSNRTIETYLNNIKNKTSCKTKKELIKLGRELDFFLN